MRDAQPYAGVCAIPEERLGRRDGRRRPDRVVGPLVLRGRTGPVTARDSQRTTGVAGLSGLLCVAHDGEERRGEEDEGDPHSISPVPGAGRRRPAPEEDYLEQQPPPQQPLVEANRESWPIRELQNFDAGLGLPGAEQHAIEQQDMPLPEWFIWDEAAKAETTRVSANAVTIMDFISFS